MHNGFVRIDDEKMSKSLDNFFTIRDVVKVHHPEAVRYFLLATHYRAPINYSEENLLQAKAALDRALYRAAWRRAEYSRRYWRDAGAVPGGDERRFQTPKPLRSCSQSRAT